MGGFGTGLGGRKLLRGRSHPGLLCTKLYPKSQSKTAPVDPTRPGFGQAPVLLFGSLAQGCAQRPRRGTSAAAQLALPIFSFPGR